MKVYYVVEVSWDEWSDATSSVERAYVGTRAKEMANKFVEDNKDKTKNKNKYYYVSHIEAEEVND